MADATVSLNDIRRSLQFLIQGERRSQVYYLVAAIAGIVAACVLIWWSSNHLKSEATLAKNVETTAIPLLTSGLSVTRIVLSETKIAQYRAAAMLTGAATLVSWELIKNTLLPKGH